MPLLSCDDGGEVVVIELLLYLSVVLSVGSLLASGHSDGVTVHTLPQHRSPHLVFTYGERGEL